MKRITIFLIVFVTAICALQAQTSYLNILQGVQLPKDSLTRVHLISNLDRFLQDTIVYNQWVNPQAKEETAMLLIELKALKNTEKDNIQPYLTNILRIGKTEYMVQVSFMSVVEGEPDLQAVFNFMVTPHNNGFLFASPLLYNTASWYSTREGYLTSFYQDDANAAYVNKSLEYTKQFDNMLGASRPTANYYCKSCNTMSDLLNLIGMPYNKTYNGKNWIMINFESDNQRFNFYTKRFFDGKEVDPHDEFHSRAYTVVPKDKRNRFMICGCAYIYGGSWLISWEDIQKRFKANVDYKAKQDWLKLYFERYNFGVSKARHLLVTQFVNALIIQQVEKEQGFSAVKKLLASGNMYKKRKEFFQVLEAVTGINENNFNTKVDKLIKDAMKKI